MSTRLLFTLKRDAVLSVNFSSFQGKGGRFNGQGRGSSASRKGEMNVTKWEYKVIDIRNDEASIWGEDSTTNGYAEIAALLNRLGEEGWELLAVADTRFIFKREKRPEGGVHLA